MPSAEVIRSPAGQLSVAEVAEQIRRHPPAGLTLDDLKLNDTLRRATEPVPTELGISQVTRWGTRFGSAPQAYWRAFREAVLDLWMERTSAENYRMAADPSVRSAGGVAVNREEEKEWIAGVVADLRAACELPEGPQVRGPVRPSGSWPNTRSGWSSCRDCRGRRSTITCSRKGASRGTWAKTRTSRASCMSQDLSAGCSSTQTIRCPAGGSPRGTNSGTSSSTATACAGRYSSGTAPHPSWRPRTRRPRRWSGRRIGSRPSC